MTDDMTSNIEWTDDTWNPVVGCSVESAGCTNCYAMKMAHRLGQNPKTPHYHGLTKQTRGGPVWTGKVAGAPDAVWEKPLRRKKPTRYFVNSMGDLFHPNVPDEWIDRAFAIMTLAPQHTFQILTKHPARMRDYMRGMWPRVGDMVCDLALEMELPVALIAHPGMEYAAPDLPKVRLWRWPIPNVWLGVSAENQEQANARIPDLLETPAAVRFVSVEPMLGPVNFLLTDARGHDIQALRGIAVDPTNPDGPDEYYRTSKLDWIICGGESGPDARPMHPDWARSLRDQCQAAGTPFFFKQWGEWAQASWDVCPDGDMSRNAAQWMGWGGRLQKPSHDGLENPVGVIRIGKKAAGRLLDGLEWNGMPAARA